jgi:NADH-quinone oxidoreductase subunit L
VLAVLAGVANLPSALPFGESWELRFEHYFEPKGAYFPAELPSWDVPEFDMPIALLSTAIGLLGIGLAYLWYWKGRGPHGITERSAVAHAGYSVLENKYGFDILYTDVIAGGVKGPVAHAVNWSNQNVLDGVVNGAGKAAAATGRFVYDQIDQTVVDGAVDGSGVVAGAGGQLLRKLTSGKVQQYGALLFGATAIGAGILVIVV